MLARAKKRGWLIAIVLIAGLQAQAPRAQDVPEDASKNVELRLDGECDPKNSRLWLLNNHPTRSIIATLRWNLAGSKRIITDQFQVAPASKREIGCAAQADVVVAAFVEQ